MKRGGWTHALTQFEAARSEEPNNPRIEAYRAWAKYQVLRNRDASAADHQNDLWLSGVAKRNCKTVIKASTEKVRDFADAYVFLGRIHLDEGKSREALVVLKKACRIDSDNVDAKRYLREAQLRAPAGASQISKRISDWFDKVTGAEKKDERIRPVKMHNVRRPHL